MNLIREKINHLDSLIVNKKKKSVFRHDAWHSRIILTHFATVEKCIKWLGNKKKHVFKTIILTPKF